MLFPSTSSPKHLYNIKANMKSLKFIESAGLRRRKFQFSYCQSQAFSEIGSDILAVCVRNIYIYIVGQYIYGMEPESSAWFGE